MKENKNGSQYKQKGDLHSKHYEHLILSVYSDPFLLPFRRRQVYLKMKFCWQRDDFDKNVLQRKYASQTAGSAGKILLIKPVSFFLKTQQDRKCSVQ